MGNEGYWDLRLVEVYMVRDDGENEPLLSRLPSARIPWVDVLESGHLYHCRQHASCRFRRRKQ